MPKINARDKGAAAERELANALKALGHDTRRHGQQGAGGSASRPDVEGIPGIHIECKRTERPRLAEAQDQVVRDAGEAVPVVAHRFNRKPWWLMVRLEDLNRFVYRVLLSRIHTEGEPMLYRTAIEALELGAATRARRKSWAAASHVALSDKYPGHLAITATTDDDTTAVGMALACDWEVV